jgi:hypothetical protein
MREGHVARRLPRRGGWRESTIRHRDQPRAVPLRRGIVGEPRQVDPKDASVRRRGQAHHHLGAVTELGEVNRRFRSADGPFAVERDSLHAKVPVIRGLDQRREDGPTSGGVEDRVRKTQGRVGVGPAVRTRADERARPVEPVQVQHGLIHACWGLRAHTDGAVCEREPPLDESWALGRVDRAPSGIEPGETVEVDGDPAEWRGRLADLDRGREGLAGRERWRSRGLADGAAGARDRSLRAPAAEPTSDCRPGPADHGDPEDQREEPPAPARAALDPGGDAIAIVRSVRHRLRTLRAILGPDVRPPNRPSLRHRHPSH